MPLWTLKYEVLCYIALGVCMAFLTRYPFLRPLTLCWLVIGVSSLWLLQGKPTMTPDFLIMSRGFLSRSGAACSLAFAPIDCDTCRHSGSPVCCHRVGYRFFLAGFAACFDAALRLSGTLCGTIPLWLGKHLHRSQRLSYGTYIYGWPIQQTLVWASLAVTRL